MNEVLVKERLAQGLNKYALQEDQIDQLVMYLTLMQRWNKTYNLTAITEPLEMVRLHLLDALTVLPLVQKKSAKALLDVGAGAGLPSIPLAICLPELKVFAVDKVQKKTSFMQHVKAELGLAQFKVMHGRIEQLNCEQFGVDGMDVIVSRAFSSLDDFVDLSKHLLLDNGSWFAMKGVLPLEELAVLEQSARYDVSIHPLEIDGVDVERHLVEIKKAAHKKV